MFQLNHLNGFNAVHNATFVLLTAAEKTAETATTITVNNVDFGNGGRIAFTFAWVCTGSSRTVSSVAINGVSATINVQAKTAADTKNVFIASANNVPGGSGNITVTYSASDTYNGLFGVYLIPGPVGDTQAINTTGTSTTVNVGAGGAILGIGYTNNNSNTNDFTGGVVTDLRASIAATARPAYTGSKFYVDATTPATISWLNSTANNFIAIAAFNP